MPAGMQKQNIRMSKTTEMPSKRKIVYNSEDKNEKDKKFVVAASKIAYVILTRRYYGDSDIINLTERQKQSKPFFFLFYIRSSQGHKPSLCFLFSVQVVLEKEKWYLGNQWK